MKWRPSIRLVMPLCMVGVALMVMVIVCVIYSTTATTMFSQLGMSNTLQAMDQVSKRLSDSIGQVEDVLREVADGMEEDRGRAGSRQFDSSLRLSAGAMENLSALLLLDEYGNPVLGLPSAESKKTCRLTSMDWFNQARTADLGETVFSRPHVQNLYPGEYPWVVSVTRKVRYWQDDLPHTGILMADMRLEPLEDICRSVTLGDNGYLYILDDSGNIIYHPEQKLMSLELISEENILSEDTQSEDKHNVYDDRCGDRRAHAQEQHPSAAALGEKKVRAERVHAARGKGHRERSEQRAQEVAGIIEMEGCDARNSDEV